MSDRVILAADRAHSNSGAVGSGKTEMRRLAIKAIAELGVAAPGKKGAKIGPQVANAEVSDCSTMRIR